MDKGSICPDLQPGMKCFEFHSECFRKPEFQQESDSILFSLFKTNSKLSPVPTLSGTGCRDKSGSWETHEEAAGGGKVTGGRH